MIRNVGGLEGSWRGELGEGIAAPVRVNPTEKLSRFEPLTFTQRQIGFCTNLAGWLAEGGTKWTDVPKRVHNMEDKTTNTNTGMGI